MRHPFTAQSEFGLVPIEKIVLPRQSRDELPPILAGLQWIWSHPTLKAEILGLLEVKILVGKKATGRTGLDLWQILVLGVVRLGLEANYDRLEDLANHHTLIRQLLGVPAAPFGTDRARLRASNPARQCRAPRRGHLARDQRPRGRCRPHRL